MLDLSSLEKACEALALSLKLYDKSPLPEDDPEKSLLRDGVIQRFEFTYELSWKMLKRYLEEYGLEKADGLNNRELFRAGWEQGLLSDPEKRNGQALVRPGSGISSRKKTCPYRYRELKDGLRRIRSAVPRRHPGLA